LAFILQAYPLASPPEDAHLRDYCHAKKVFQRELSLVEKIWQEFEAINSDSVCFHQESAITVSCREFLALFGSRDIWADAINIVSIKR